MTENDYGNEECLINNARAAAIADLDKYLSTCGLTVDQRNKAMDLLVPIVAHVKALAQLKQPVALKALRDELCLLATLLRERTQIAQTQSQQHRSDRAA